VALLAAAGIAPAAHDCRVARRLTGYAGPRAGQSKTPALRNPLAAILAIVGTFARRHPCAGAEHGILHRIVDLILHRAIARPTAGHR
jgi:hypothetical protein